MTIPLPRPRVPQPSVPGITPPQPPAEPEPGALPTPPAIEPQPPLQPPLIIAS